jgi:hypothetical protein
MFDQDLKGEYLAISKIQDAFAEQITDFSVLEKHILGVEIRIEHPIRTFAEHNFDVFPAENIAIDEKAMEKK